MRASDADREAVVEQLREAAAEGRIDMDELDTRLGQALSAKTYAELAPLTEDLVPIEVATGEPLVLKGGVHGMTRAGVWKVPRRSVPRAASAASGSTSPAPSAGCARSRWKCAARWPG